MRKVLGLLVLATLLLAACAETNSSSRVSDRASLCAMCGASVGPDYFANTTFRGLGPGNY
jgi:hypothetical protein